MKKWSYDLGEYIFDNLLAVVGRDKLEEVYPDCAKMAALNGDTFEAWEVVYIDYIASTLENDTQNQENIEYQLDKIF